MHFKSSWFVVLLLLLRIVDPERVERKLGNSFVRCIVDPERVGKCSEESRERYGTNIVKPSLELGGGSVSLDDLRATFVNIMETPSLE